MWNGKVGENDNFEKGSAHPFSKLVKWQIHPPRPPKYIHPPSTKNKQIHPHFHNVDEFTHYSSCFHPAQRVFLLMHTKRGGKKKRGNTNNSEQAVAVLSQDFEVRGQTRILRWQLVEVARERSTRQTGQWSQKLIRNANVLIMRVPDLCVKLLEVLHISNAQGRSVDFSVTIATCRRRMVDLISTPGRMAEALYCS